MKQKIYLLAIITSVFTLWLYIPKFAAYAQDRAEQKELAKQILDLNLELSDIQSEWQVFNDTKLEKQTQLKTLSWEIAEIEQTQNELHDRAEQIRKELSILNWTASVNDQIVNCYQWTWQEYNDCLDAIISVGLQQRRQPQ